MIVVKNGTRVPVEFVRPGGGYKGLAAIEDNRVLFASPVSALRGVKGGIVDGKPVRVVSASPSPLVASILIVEFEELAS